MTATKPLIWIATAALSIACLSGCSASANDTSTSTDEATATTASAAEVKPSESAAVDPVTMSEVETLCGAKAESDYPGAVIDWAGGVTAQEADPTTGAITVEVAAQVVDANGQAGSTIGCTVGGTKSAPELTNFYAY
ncbi:hypothetical protein [Pseudoclavibacter helvolus]|uniref:hypothetical protein n=1 Tax=Pseudoclavibacter helvolus TaxID=255205 RepID=UPI003736C94B